MVTTEELGLIIALGMCFAFLMGLGMVLLARKNRIIHELGERLVQEEKDRKEIELLHNTISTQETERNRIARRLHDEVGALLSIVSKNLSYVDDSFKKGNLNGQCHEIFEGWFFSSSKEDTAGEKGRKNEQFDP